MYSMTKEEEGGNVLHLHGIEKEKTLDDEHMPPQALVVRRLGLILFVLYSSMRLTRMRSQRTV